jgi:hypothetical protein
VIKILNRYTLNPEEFTLGLSASFIVFFSVAIGIFIASRYFKYGDRNFLYIGFSWIGLNSGWWPTSVSFLTTIFLGIPLSDTLYFAIGNIGIPIFAMVWILAITELMYQEKKKLILLLYGLFVGFFEAFTLISLILYPSPNLLGEVKGPVDVEYETFYGLYLIAITFSIVLTGILFARKSLKSKKKVNQLKGKFLIVAFITYFIGAILDAIFPLSEVIALLLIVRIALIVSGFLFYLGWIMPNAFKEKLIKEPTT